MGLKQYRRRRVYEERRKNADKRMMYGCFTGKKHGNENATAGAFVAGA
jgi:hypothetical protein